MARAKKASCVDTFSRLQALYPDAHCELVHRNVFELLCATVLSAQTTDVAVNRITPALFERFPNALAMGNADRAEVEKLISTIGMFRQKTKNLIALSRLLIERHGGHVPASMEELIELPGVGRKTANVVLGVAFAKPEGVVVDTHVQRIAQRLGWTREAAPEKIERDLCSLFPRGDWDPLSHVLIFHGRRTCFARKPNCAECGVSDACPSAFQAETVGRKPSRARTKAGKSVTRKPGHASP